MADQKIGQLLDTLGVTAQLDDGDLPTDALVILKVLQPDGQIAIAVCCSETLDWVAQKGLLYGAMDITAGGFRARSDGDDE